MTFVAPMVRALMGRTGDYQRAVTDAEPAGSSERW